MTFRNSQHNTNFLKVSNIHNEHSKISSLKKYYTRSKYTERQPRLSLGTETVWFCSVLQYDLYTDLKNTVWWIWQTYPRNPQPNKKENISITPESSLEPLYSQLVHTHPRQPMMVFIFLLDSSVFPKFPV